MSRYVKDTNGNWNLSAGIPQIDNELDSTSENPVQNKAIVEGISPMFNILGAKNLLPITATTQTIDGITYTVNPNGSVRAQGAVTSGQSYSILYYDYFDLDAGEYILSGCPSGGGNDKWGIWINAGSASPSPDIGDGTRFTLSSKTSVRVRIGIVTHENVDLTFYPMIRPASVADDTYVPYAMTNRELTNDLNDNSLSSVTSSYGTIEGGYKKIGKIVIVNIRLTTNTSISSGTLIIEGLPAATGTLNKVAIATSVQQTTAILNTTAIQLNTTQDLPSGTILILSATYVSNK